ncbi:unnamed protein product [Urochloa humidicola]
MTPIYDPKTSSEIHGPRLVDSMVHPILIHHGFTAASCTRSPAAGSPSVLPGVDFMPWFFVPGPEPALYMAPPAAATQLPVSPQPAGVPQPAGAPRRVLRRGRLPHPALRATRQGYLCFRCGHQEVGDGGRQEPPFHRPDRAPWWPPLRCLLQSKGWRCFSILHKGFRARNYLYGEDGVVHR